MLIKNFTQKWIILWYWQDSDRRFRKVLSVSQLIFVLFLLLLHGVLLAALEENPAVIGLRTVIRKRRNLFQMFLLKALILFNQIEAYGYEQVCAGIAQSDENFFTTTVFDHFALHTDKCSGNNDNFLPRCETLIAYFHFCAFVKQQFEQFNLPVGYGSSFPFEGDITNQSGSIYGIVILFFVNSDKNIGGYERLFDPFKPVAPLVAPAADGQVGLKSGFGEACQNFFLGAGFGICSVPVEFVGIFKVHSEALI